MCRSTAAPLMAMAGMAGTAVGVAIAVLKEKADRRSIEREAREEQEAEDSGNTITKQQADMQSGDSPINDRTDPAANDENKPGDA